MTTTKPIVVALAAAIDPSSLHTPERSLARFHELCDAMEIEEGPERAKVFIGLPDGVQKPLWVDIGALYAEAEAGP